MKLSKSFTTVTPFTRRLALSMLVIFPICGFFLGMYYQQLHDMNKPEQVVVEYKMIQPTPLPSLSVPPVSIQTCQTNNDCPTGDFCTRSGPIIVNPKTKALPPMTCHKKGTVVPF